MTEFDKLRPAGIRRQLPRWSDIQPLIGLAAPRLRRSAKLSTAADIRDLRRLARRRVPQAVFDYVDGGAENEVSLRRDRQAYRDVVLRPQILRDVSAVDASRTILGRRAAAPIVLAPTGFTRMMHTAGEPAIARAAAAHGLPYALSTMGTTTPEDLQTAAPDGRHWFQLYVWRDRAASESLLARAHQSGFEALVLTVDTSVPGSRLRDVRNGLTVPPRLTLKTLVDMAAHPSWWLDLLTTEPLVYASLSAFDGSLAELTTMMFDPSVTFDEIAWLREHWDGPLVVKGLQSPDDARRALHHGADALVVSTHGGRQLDRSPTPLLELPAIRTAVGDDVEIYVDGGILSGGDIVAAVAAGATAVMIGRIYLYGLMAGGEAGVDRALTIVTEELKRTLQLLGVSSIDDLRPEHVTLPTRPR